VSEPVWRSASISAVESRPLSWLTTGNVAVTAAEVENETSEPRTPINTSGSAISQIKPMRSFVNCSRSFAAMCHILRSMLPP